VDKICTLWIKNIIFMKTLIYILAALFLVSCENTQLAEEQYVSLYSGPWEYWPIETVDVLLADQIHFFINDHRESKGLNSLAKGSSLSSALASRHCNYMIYSGQLSHDGFDERAETLANLGAQAVGENVAFGYEDAHEVVNAWFNSQEHRDTMEGNYTHVGIGIIKDVLGVTYVTAIFYRN